VKTLTFHLISFALCTIPVSCQSAPSFESQYQVICQTLDQHFFDLSYPNIDWPKIKNFYAGKIRDVDGQDEFCILVNEMLDRFNVSHLALLHPEMKDPLFQLVSKEGWVGLHVQVVEGQMVVSKVSPNSPAEKASFKMGQILLRVAGKTISNFISESETFRRPPFHLRSDQAMLNMRVQFYTYGEIGELLEIESKASNGIQTQRLSRVKRPGKTQLHEGLPVSFLDFETKDLKGGITYIRFNYFAHELLDQIHSAINNSNGARMIIDLRGNFGGLLEVRKSLADRFGREPALLWSQHGRRGRHDLYLEPPDNPFPGHLVILVDSSSASAAEEFAGGLQALSLATVIGEQTQGKVLVADFQEISRGVTLMYPVAITELANGVTLEGGGVIPDIEIKPTLASLQSGRDCQLEKAVAFLLETQVPASHQAH